MTYKAQIDETACAAHGDCEAIAPEVFRVGDTAVVIGTGPDRGHEKLPTGGHLIPHPSGSGSTVRCSRTLDRREDAHEERKDTGGDHRAV